MLLTACFFCLHNVFTFIIVVHRPSAAVVVVYIEDSDLAVDAGRLQISVVDEIEKSKYFMSVYLLAVVSSQQKSVWLRKWCSIF